MMSFAMEKSRPQTGRPRWPLHALDDERARFCRLGADCVDLLLGGRIVPALHLLLAVEGDDDGTLRRFPVEGCNLVGTGQIATSRILKNSRRGLRVPSAPGSVAGRVCDLVHVDPHIDRGRGLGMECLHGGGAKSSADDQRHYESAIYFHGSLLMLSLPASSILEF